MEYFVSVTKNNYCIIQDGVLVSNTQCSTEGKDTDLRLVLHNTTEALEQLLGFIRQEDELLQVNTEAQMVMGGCESVVEVQPKESASRGVRVVTLEARSPLLSWILKGVAPNKYGDDFLKLMSVVEKVDAVLNIVYSKDVVASYYTKLDEVGTMEYTTVQGLFE